MKKDITLYNHWHNGDIFYSRILVNILLEYFNITYYHNLPSPLFEDMPDVIEINGIPPNFNLHHSDLSNFLVNTWIGQDEMFYVLKQPIIGCSFDNHFKLVRNICDFYNIILDGDKSKYLPKINYEKLSSHDIIKNQMKQIKEDYKLIILVCDGDVNSGQSNNFDFTPIIKELSKNNPNSLFISTNQEYTSSSNILQSYSNLTYRQPDLLDIGLISSYCDIIIGRASGPFCFSHTIDNFNNKDKTFISFTFTESEGIFYYDGKNKNIWSNNFNNLEIFDTIQQEINLKLNKI